MNRTTLLQDRRMQKFRDVLSRWESGDLSMMEAGELLGMSERQFRRYRDRYEEAGEDGLRDRRLGKPSARRVPEGERQRMLELYRECYGGWNVKHFHEHLQHRHGFAWGYTWTKTQLHAAGLVERARRRGAHRRKRPRKPCEGMMLHQDGSRFGWLAGQPQLDLIVTMDDATSTIYSAFMIEEEGTASSFRGLLETFTAYGLPSSLYTDRGSHYFYTAKAGATVDKQRLTQVGRALQRLGIEHIPAYSPEARGRSERMFGTLQERLPKELKLAGITDMETANRFICELYLPAHNARFAKPPEIAESAFVTADPVQIAEILCVEEERVVCRDNTVAWGGLHLQLPHSRLRQHYVRATVKVRQYPNGTLAIFHGPRCIGRYDAKGCEIGEPISTMLHPCSTPSRRGLEASRPAPPAVRRPALTASRHGAGAS
jgi:transposase